MADYDYDYDYDDMSENTTNRENYLLASNDVLRVAQDNLRIQHDYRLKEMDALRDQLKQAGRESAVLREYVQKVCLTNERLFRLFKAAKLTTNYLRQAYRACLAENDRLRGYLTRLEGLFREELHTIASEFPSRDDDVPSRR